MKNPSPTGLKASIAAIALGCVCLAGTASATIIITNTKNVAPSGGASGAAYDPSTAATNPLTASSTDLIQGKLATVTDIIPASDTANPGASSNTNESSRGTVAWTDGSLVTAYSGGGDAISHNAYGTVGAQTGGAARQVVATYDLGSLYNLTAVNVYTGWNDSGRDDSSFIVLVSTDGTNYTPLGPAYTKPTPDDTSTGPKTPVTNLHSMTDDGGANIASGVRYVQVEFTDADNGYAGVAEIDVLGAAVPEASTAALGLLGGLLLVRRKRN